MYPARVTPEFLRRGWEVHGIALKASRVADSFRQAGIDPLLFDTRVHALLSVSKVLRYLKEHDIRIVHAHKSGDMRLGALLVSLWPELRLFFTDHMGVRKPKKDLYHRWAYSKLTRLFAISNATYKRNLKAFPLPPDRVQQLYYGIDLSAFDESVSSDEQAATRQSLALSDTPVIIALPGRISESKGHLRWVEALSRLKVKPGLPKWVAVFIGEAGGRDAAAGGFADQLRDRIVALGLSDDVVFAGFRFDLARCLRAVDVVCIPSFDEAFGLSVIEAMAAGCPVVGSDSGAIPELITADRGRIAPPDDPEAWAEALVELLCDEDKRKAMGLAASQWVHEEFGMQRHVDALATSYTVRS